MRRVEMSSSSFLTLWQGYLRAGKIYLLMNKDKLALKCYTLGCNNVPTSDMHSNVRLHARYFVVSSLMC